MLEIGSNGPETGLWRGKGQILGELSQVGSNLAYGQRAGADRTHDLRLKSEISRYTPTHAVQQGPMKSSRKRNWLRLVLDGFVHRSRTITRTNSVTFSADQLQPGDTRKRNEEQRERGRLRRGHRPSSWNVAERVSGQRWIGRPAQNVQVSGGVLHAHAWRPLASLSDEEVALVDKLTRKLSQPVLNASPNAPLNQIESKLAIEAEVVESGAVEG